MQCLKFKATLLLLASHHIFMSVKKENFLLTPAFQPLSRSLLPPSHLLPPSLEANENSFCSRTPPSSVSSPALLFRTLPCLVFVLVLKLTLLHLLLTRKLSSGLHLFIQQNMEGVKGWVCPSWVPIIRPSSSFIS